MGLSSSSKTQTYTPSAQQTQAASALTSAYQGNQANVANITGQFNSLLPGATSTASAANTAASGAAGYYNDVLGGKYLNAGNPYLSGIINTTDNSIRDQVDGQFSAAGRTGSGANQYALAKALSENENNLRYGDYNSQLSRMDSAASGASSLSSSSLGSLLGLGTTAANLPFQQAQGYASGIGGLGIGGSTKTTDSGSLGSVLGQALQLGSLFTGGGGLSGLLGGTKSAGSAMGPGINNIGSFQFSAPSYTPQIVGI